MILRGPIAWLLLSGVAVLFGWIAWGSHQHAEEVKTWLEAPATVISVGHHTRTHYDKTYDNDRERRTEDEHELRYRYNVAGKDYEGHERWRDSRGIEYWFSATKPYSSGQLIIIRYDPVQPARSDFQHQSPTYPWPIALLALLWWLFDVTYLKKRRR